MRQNITIDDSYQLTQKNLGLLFAILEAQPERFAPQNEIAESRIEQLSRSERRVLRYLPTHLSRPAIARELYVSVNTVNTHIRNIYSKLDATSRAEAVERARQRRLITR